MMRGVIDHRPYDRADRLSSHHWTFQHRLGKVHTFSMVRATVNDFTGPNVLA